VADRDSSPGSDRGEDAAWRELVAHYHAPVTAEQAVPWPDREDVAAARETLGAGGPAADGMPGPHEPDVIQAPRVVRAARAGGGPAGGVTADDDEQFGPPAPPPLPRLDPVAKGAWAALFGGPGYLVVATAVGWSVPGLAAFCAVAAFVAGFTTLVLRMNEPGPGGPDDGDDGAVV
jgi:hypothetical protein